MFRRKSLAACLVALSLLAGSRAQAASVVYPPPTVEIEVNQIKVACQTIMRAQKLVGIICYVARRLHLAGL